MKTFIYYDGIDIEKSILIHDTTWSGALNIFNDYHIGCKLVSITRMK